MTDTSAPNPTELLDLAVQAALSAGGLLLERFGRVPEADIHAKSTPTDLVSEADLAAQRAIAELLARARPQDGFLGEEDTGPASVTASSLGVAGDGAPGGPGGAAATGGDLAGPSGLRWVVDPLDGTVNFLFGIPQWCVSVAVQDSAGKTLAGAIFDPCRDELWTATIHSGAALNGAPVVGPQREDLATAMIATGLAYDATVRAAQAQVLARLVPRVRDIRRFGSAALDLAWTAAGRFDAYFERTTKLWDIAAGALICERAGLRVAELAEHPDLPWGIAAGPDALLEPLLELVG